MSELEFVQWTWAAFLFWHLLVGSLTLLVLTLVAGIGLMIWETFE